MSCAKNLLALAALCAAARVAAAACEELPPWSPGIRSEETLAYGFVARGLRIRPADALGFRGTLEASGEMKSLFTSIGWTQGARTVGENRMVYRGHRGSVHTRQGVAKSDWKWIAEKPDDVSNAGSFKVGARWNNPDAVAEAYKGLEDVEGETVSPYAAADDGYIPNVEDLLLIWDQTSFVDGRFRPGAVDVGPVNPGDRTYRRRSANSQARPLLAAGVNTECAVLCALLNLPVKMTDEVCEIDASVLNAGLGRALGGQLAFGGRLTLKRSAVTPADCTRRGLPRFTGVVVQAVGSADLTVAYAGGAPQPIRISLEDDSRVELWYDGIEQTLRLADVRLHVRDYRGQLPDAQLTAFARALQGEYRGDVTFLLQYIAKQEVE